MDRVELSLLAGVLCAIGLILGVTAVYPSVDDLWVENPFWNGLSEFYRETRPERLGDLTSLEALPHPGNTTLFIVGPSTGFTDAEAQQVADYLGRGGTLVLMDDFGTGNQLLSKLGLPPMFHPGLVLKDPLFRDKDSLMPVIVPEGYPGVQRLVLNYAAVLRDVPEASVTARSSPFSYTASTIDEAPGRLEPSPVAAKLGYGEGALLLISDSSIFINSMINRGDNRRLLQAIAQRDTLIDEAHSAPSKLTTVKRALASIYTALGYLELRYGLALITAAGIMATRVKESAEPLDPVEALLRRHPEYDRELVQTLHRERERTHGHG